MRLLAAEVQTAALSESTERIHASLVRCSLIVLLLASLLSHRKRHRPITRKSGSARTGVQCSLPTEETVNAFMQQMFGHDSSVSWKVLEIKPAEAEGLAEVTVTVAMLRESKTRSCTSPLMDTTPLWATSFLRRASFRPAREHSRGNYRAALGPPDAPSPWVEFSDLQCPYCKQAQPTITSSIEEKTRA